VEGCGIQAERRGLGTWGIIAGSPVWGIIPPVREMLSAGRVGTVPRGSTIGLTVEVNVGGLAPLLNVDLSSKMSKSGK
jgi:hypothetical protein